MANVMTVKGRVFTGKKEGSRFVTLLWIMKQFRDKLGFTPYPGTLNLRVSSGSKIKEILERHPGVRIEPEEGFYQGKCFNAIVLGRIHGAVVIPEVPKYPTDVLEVLAPVCLRKEFNLKDCDEVHVSIMLE